MIKTKEAFDIYNSIWKNYIKPSLEAIEQQPMLIHSSDWIVDFNTIQFDAQNGNEFGESLVAAFINYLAKEQINAKRHNNN